MNNDDLAKLIRTIPDYPKPGIMFRDVSTLVINGGGFKTAIDRMADMVPEGTSLIAGIEARGFVVAAGLCHALGLGMVMLRKPGKLPGETIGADYMLEYGTDRIEMHTGQVNDGQRVLLVDDLIATGGTAMAGVELLRCGGAIVEHALFIVELPALNGADLLRSNGLEIRSLISFDGE